MRNARRVAKASKYNVHVHQFRAVMAQAQKNLDLINRRVTDAHAHTLTHKRESETLEQLLVVVPQAHHLQVPAAADTAPASSCTSQRVLLPHQVRDAQLRHVTCETGGAHRWRCAVLQRQSRTDSGYSAFGSRARDQVGQGHILVLVVEDVVVADGGGGGGGGECRALVGGCWCWMAMAMAMAAVGGRVWSRHAARRRKLQLGKNYLVDS